MTNPLEGKSIVLGVTGSIAAFKAVDLASKLAQAGARVGVVLTPAAAEFVPPLSFRGVTQGTVIVDMWAAAEEHIELARRADVVVVAPATATSIARLAQGLAEDMVSLTVLATRAPVLVCPAMDSQMFEHPATQGNLIRVPLPALSEERRKELVKVVHKLAEEGRIAVRHARTETMSKIKKLEKVPEDDKTRAEKDVQKLTDEHIKQIDGLIHAKEAEIMEV